MSWVSLQQGNAKNPRNQWRCLILKDKIFISSQRLKESQWNFQERLADGNAKSYKNRISVSLGDTFLEKLQGASGQTDPLAFLGYMCSSSVPSSLYLDIDKTLRAWELCRSSVILWRIQTSFFYP